MSLADLHGALVIDKPAGISSFGVIEELQHGLARATGVRRRELPKLGHGGTLDPFATGVLVVCVGDGVKLARYFLGSDKEYVGHVRFGRMTASGDPTNEVTGTTDIVPAGLAEIAEAARRMTIEPYSQVPPMHSAKKIDGQRMYELARQNKVIDLEPVLCQLPEFEIQEYQSPVARFRVRVSSGTYIRVLAQDLAARLGSLGMLDSLRRTAAGRFKIDGSIGTTAVIEAAEKDIDSVARLPAWVPFDRMLDGFSRVDATAEEARALHEGRQGVIRQLVGRAERPPGADLVGAIVPVAVYDPRQCLTAVLRGMELERVFARSAVPRTPR